MLFVQAVGLPEGDTIGPHLESARAVRLCLTSPRDLAFTWRRDGKQRIRATVKKQMNDTQLEAGQARSH